jgi:phytoene dehydrogenase-like protein
VAVIGSGVSGLTAAWILARDRDVTLYEAEPRLGGHADTHRVTAPDGTPLDIDTGFIVHNTRTYPLLTRLFGELGVAVQPSEMSMSVRCLGCGLEYAGQRGLPGIAAGLRRGRGRYLRMLAEVGRFHAAARALLRSQDPGGGPAAGPSRGPVRAAGPRPARRSASSWPTGSTPPTASPTSCCRSWRRSGRAHPAPRLTTPPGTCSRSSTSTGCSR